jgi:hypothetical protein
VGAAVGCAFTGALVGTGVGVSGGAVAAAVAVAGTAVADAVPETLTWVAFEGAVAVAEVEVAEAGVGSESDSESDAPQAAKTATAAAAKRRTGRRRMVLPRRFVSPVFPSVRLEDVTDRTNEVAIAHAMATRHGRYLRRLAARCSERSAGSDEGDSDRAKDKQDSART